MEEIIFNRDRFSGGNDTVKFRCVTSLCRRGNGKQSAMLPVVRGGCVYTLRKIDIAPVYKVLDTDDSSFRERFPDMEIKISDWELEEHFTAVSHKGKTVYAWSTDDDYVDGNRADSIEECINDAKRMYGNHEEMFEDENVTTVQIGACEDVDPRHAMILMVDTFKEKLDDYIDDNYMCDDSFKTSELTDEEKLEMFAFLYRKAREKAGHLFVSWTILEYDLEKCEIIKDWRQE